MNLELLSPDQRAIYDAAMRDNRLSSICKAVNKTSGVVRANLTRMRNKSINVTITDDLRQGTTEEEPATSTNPGDTVVEQRDVTRFPEEGVTAENVGEVLRDVKTAGPALSAADIEAAITAARAQGAFGDKLDAHPLILMGMTIQYCRMAGGRLLAHQLIEDIYGVVRALTGDSTIGDFSTQPGPDAGKVTLPGVLESFRAMTKNLEDLVKGQD